MSLEKRILVPLDFSPASVGILDAALDLAEQCGGKLILLHVVEPFDPMRQRPPLILTDVLDDYARLVHRMPHERVSTHAVAGDPITVILEVAADSQCDTIVMGRGGKNGKPGHVAEAIPKHFHGRTRLIDPIPMSGKALGSSV